MVKKNSKNSKPKPRSKAPSRKTKNPSSGLDAGAIAYARMLADPCNAPMHAPTYNGMGTGQYRRFRSIIQVPSSVEGTYMFVPGANVYHWATHTAANAGTPYTFNYQGLFSTGELDLSIESRCLAACVKVRYTGSEQSRSGVVGLRTSPYNYIIPGEVSNNPDQLAACTVLNRTGEVMHEVKFVPGTGDELFTGNYVGGSALPVPARAMGAFGFTYSGWPVGSLQLEVTGIIELETRGSLVPGVIPPQSRSTTNEVLAALGPPVRWAFGHANAPTIRSNVGQARTSYLSGNTSSSATTRLITV